MLTTHTIPAIRNALGELRNTGLKIGYVPTMGALHEGHISLIRKAMELSDAVIVSIFVNPTQFGPDEDFSTYPRPLESDLDICKKHGVHAVFHPPVEELYDGDEQIRISAGELSSRLCGKTRPGHFDGVLQVVNKFFNIIQPDVAVFGQKDIQQLLLIRQMVTGFRMNIDILMAPTQREPDGLAISSRNQYLSGAERNAAPLLYRALKELEELIRPGEINMDRVTAPLKKKLEQKGLKIDYISCVEPPHLHQISRIEKGKNYILAGAVFAGQTRLIDNLIIYT
ncbi:MAG: pantoate--beta-alanine ligase [Balneolales bacterium]